MPKPMRKRQRTASASRDNDGSGPSSAKDSSSVTVVLRSLSGNGTGATSSASTATSPTPYSITLTGQTPKTSVYEIKVSYAQEIGVGRDTGSNATEAAAAVAAAKKAAEKMKIFHAKKLCTDSKTLAEIVGGEEKLWDESEGERKVELRVMVLGKLGAAKAENDGSEGEKPAKETGTTAVLQTGEFWDDLRGFLAQRLKNEDDVRRTVEMFRRAWVDGQK